MTLLRGVNWSGYEYGNSYGISSSTIQTLKNQWNVNIIRFSFNRNDYLTNSSYTQHMRDVTNWSLAQGVTVILDHQWESQSTTLSGLPNQSQTVQLWSTIAQDSTYQNKAVWFDLWNEPHDCTISQWRSIVQSCVNEIRKYANNIILVAGINWADDVASWHGNYINDNNIVYSRHNYGPAYGGTSASNMDNQEGVLLKDGQQIFIGEFGCCDSSNCSCSSSAVNNIQNVLLPWLDGKTRGSGIAATPLGFTAWSMCDTPLLLNQNGNLSSGPTPYGTVVQNELKSNIITNPLTVQLNIN
jgi:hypothetical protein